MTRFAILAIVVFSIGCAAPAPSEPAPRHYPSAGELRRCPFGHASLKDVPIVYGLIIRDPDHERAIEDLEFCEGGCVITIGGPRHRVICRDCRYNFEPFKRTWYKSSADRAAFQRPLSSLVAELPAPAGAVVRYDQTVDEGGGVVDEAIRYYASGTTLDLASRINAHVQKQCPIRVEGPASQYPAGTSITQRGVRDDGWVVTYYLEYYVEMGRVSVSFVCARPEFAPRWYTEK